MAGSPQERVLASEMLVVMSMQTADALSGGYTGAVSLPDPSRYFATIVVYLMLAGLAMFGEKPARLAGAFGGVAALAIVLGPTKQSKAAGKPQALAVSAFNYLAQMIGGGSYGSKAAGSPSSFGAGSAPTYTPLPPNTPDSSPPKTTLPTLGTGVVPAAGGGYTVIPAP